MEFAGGEMNLSVRSDRSFVIRHPLSESACGRFAPKGRLITDHG